MTRTAAWVSACMLAGCLTALPPPPFGRVTPPDAYVGTWRGQCDAGEERAGTRRIALEFTIDAEGDVTGVLGDALLTDGQFHRNAPPPLGSPNFVVRADLDGELIEAENLRRRAMTALVFVDGADMQCEVRAALSERVVGTSDEMGAFECSCDGVRQR